MTTKTGLGENPLSWITNTTKKVENQKSREEEKKNGRKPENQKSRTVEQYKGRKVENQKSRTFKDTKDQISLWLPKELVSTLKIEAVHSKTKISEIMRQALANFLSNKKTHNG